MATAVAEKTTLKLKPLGSRVIVKPLKQDEMTLSGIVLPDTAREKPVQGTVIAVGPGDRDEDGKRIPLDVKVGDTVVFQKYSGTEWKQFSYAEDEFLIISEKDILAVLEK